MPHRILNEDWSDYDKKKKKWEDRFFFSCDEPWEIDYLIGKIRKHEPTKSDATIRAAIASCCKTISGNKPRETFVKCVMGKL